MVSSTTSSARQGDSPHCTPRGGRQPQAAFNLERWRWLCGKRHRPAHRRFEPSHGSHTAEPRPRRGPNRRGGRTAASTASTPAAGGLSASSPPALPGRKPGVTERSLHRRAAARIQSTGDAFGYRHRRGRPARSRLLRRVDAASSVLNPGIPASQITAPVYHERIAEPLHAREPSRMRG